MLATTHLAFVVLLGLFLSLDRNEWFVAVMFGFLVDLDHLFGMPRYVDSNGYSALLAASWDDGSGEPWKSLMHYPVGAVLVVPVAIGWRLMIPLLFWGSHIGLDYLQMATLAYSAIVEALLFMGLLAGIFLLSFRTWKLDVPEGDVRAYLRHLVATVKSSWIVRSA